MASRIGITMRTMTSPHHGEKRDAIAWDWANLLQRLVPTHAWILLPNLGKGIEAYAKAWHLDGFILTGGDDVGTCAERDETEFQLLQFATRERLPVVGICRGMQVIQVYFGGTLSRCSGHKGGAHSVVMVHPYLHGKPLERSVNSYHNWGVLESELAGSLRSFAISKDGLVEGLQHHGLPVTGIQWHPERTQPAEAGDLELLRRALEME